ncbi:hypothetical protein BJ875DRAFT_380388 [Amylocarpus encephaloides]|uniref:Uncharacterized protein n=1 Tax=Amylocarpus encephaloides TaxID=45428 RepID=A0A9P8C3H9_9HELO|nr:hypothetical protein BJ875DRAFT_380388 [Amylocarpus encephaloides]
MQLYEDANPNAFLQSITEEATASTRVSPEDTRFNQNIEEVQEALEILAETVPQVVESFTTCVKESPNSQVMIKQSDSHPGAAAISIGRDNDDHLVSRLRSILARIARFPNTVEGHARRLEDLENGLFTNPAVEDLQEGHTLMDIRLSELENRLDEVEKVQIAQADVSSVGSVHNAGSSFDSRISTTSSAMIAQAIDHVDFSRITALEAQVAELQSLVPPSHTRPWQVEVVFLPFGSNLKAIWSSHHSMTQLSRTNSGADDTFTQAQNQSLAAAQASLATHEQSLAWERSTADVASDEDAPWLTAKACGTASRVDQRLRSRGLVKLVEVKGPDAKDVQAAMMLAFGNLPDLLVEDPFTHHEADGLNTISSALSQYIGLQALWVPLRKLHKNSTLRFLNTSEMVTPALWTVQFLASSVAMRTSGLRRLYVTQRDSYIQHHGDPSDWTWQKLRQLPRVYPYQQTSMQSIVPLKSPAQSSKRRVTSFERQTQSSPTPVNSGPSGNLAIKRRRLSRSPSRQRDTPRWSNGPPSPYVPTEETANKRCSTPFAYATPHSNAPYVDTRPKSAENIEIWEDSNSEEEHGIATNDIDMNDNDSEDWDQNALSDLEPGFSEQGSVDGGNHLPHQHDDEWQGVGDGIEYDSRPNSFGVSGQSLVESLRLDIENDHDDAQSDESSQPSEYPSTQIGLPFGPKVGFKIHVDEEVEEV